MPAVGPHHGKDLVMCDYSAKGAKTRAAEKNDVLVSRDISVHTRGFTGVTDPGTAVCLMPGTELAFDKNIVVDAVRTGKGKLGATIDTGCQVARFRQVNKENAQAHHDALELSNGEVIMLDHLASGQTATVLQLPADPSTMKDAGERKQAEADQRRVVYV